jgi:hypothetical protein
MEERLATRDPLMAQQEIKAVMQEEQLVTMAATEATPMAATEATVGVLHPVSQERIAKALLFPYHSKNMVGCTFCVHTRNNEIQFCFTSMMPFMLPC